MYGWSNTAELSLKLFTVFETSAASQESQETRILRIPFLYPRSLGYEDDGQWRRVQRSASATDYEAAKSRTHTHTHATHSVLTTIIDRPHRAAAYPHLTKKTAEAENGMSVVYLLEYYSTPQVHKYIELATKPSREFPCSNDHSVIVDNAERVLASK